MAFSCAYETDEDVEKLKNDIKALGAQKNVSFCKDEIPNYVATFIKPSSFAYETEHRISVVASKHEDKFLRTKIRFRVKGTYLQPYANVFFCCNDANNKGKHKNLGWPIFNLDSCPPSISELDYRKTEGLLSTK